MSNRARKPLTRKLMFSFAFVMVSAIATLAAFGPQAISLQSLLTPFVGASVAPQQSSKEVESQLHAEPPAPLLMPGGTLATARSGHSATLLADGKVLIVGGSGDTSAEVFDPAAGMAVATGNTNYARTGHTATRLSDGRVLIAGGGNAVSEIYNPTTQTFELGPEMTATRTGHTATAVGSDVVITGGGTDSVEVFNGTAFTAAGSLTQARTNHSAAAMNDGRIFIAGGNGSDTAEIYNPASGTSVATGNPLAHARARAHLRVLPDGKVQIIGGNDDVSMEVYDPAIDTIGAHVHLLPDTDTCTGLRTGVRDSQTRAAVFFAGNANVAYDLTGHTITEVSGNQALVIGGTTGGSASNAVTPFASSPATITTDKLDYAPGETVTFSGTGFAAGETVRVVIHEDPHTHLERNFEAVADASGNISGSYLVEVHDLNVKFIVNARGLSSNLTAQTAFTDGRAFIGSVSAPGSSANIVYAVFNGNATCTGAPTTSNSALLFHGFTVLAGQVGGSRSVRMTADATATDGKVFNGWTVTVTSGTAPAGVDLSQLTICLAGDGGNGNSNQGVLTYTANYITIATNIVVSPASGTFGGTAALSATLTRTTSPVGPLSGRTVTFSLNGGVYTATAVTDPAGIATIPAASLVGINAGTYPTGVSASFAGGGGFAPTSNTASLTVNRANPTVTATGGTFSYDGNSHTGTCTVTGIAAVDLGPLEATHTPSDPPVNAGSYTVNCNYAQSQNYNAASDTESLTISPRNTITTVSPASGTFGGGPVTLSASVVSDPTGVPIPAGSTVTFNIKQGATVINTLFTNTTPGGNASVSYSLAGVNAGSYTIEVTYSSTTNFNSSTGSNTLTINRANPTVTASGGTFTYDGDPHTGSCTVTGIAAVDLGPLAATHTPTDPPVNAGSYTVTCDYAESQNYNAASYSEALTINQAQSVTTVSCPVSVPYTSVAQTPCTVSVTGGTLNLSPAANYTNNENVETATANYTYAGDPNHIGSSGSDTFEITAIALTINGAVANDKVYNGDNIATVNFGGASLATLIGGDTVTIDFSGNSATFADQNVGQNKAVTVLGVTLSGIDAGNYTVSQPTGLVADITAKQVTLVDAVANTKVYDGGFEATVDFTNASLDGVESGDTVGFNTTLYDAEFGSKDVNTGIAVTVTGVTLNGDQADNYQLVEPTLLFADITARLVTASINPQTKVYDGNASATLIATDFVVGNTVSGEAFTVNQTVGAYNDADVADAYTVTASLLEAHFDPDNGATLLSNYDFPATASGTGTITKALTTTTVTFETVPYIYRGSAFTATASVTGAGGLSQSVTPVNYSGDCLNVTVPNGCSAEATYAESANHFSSNETKYITITPATPTVTVTFGPTPITYDGNPHPASVTVNGVSGPLSGVDGTTATTYTKNTLPFAGTPTDAGSYTASASFTSANANYTNAASTIDAVLTIDKAASLTEITCPTNVTYTGLALTPCTVSVTGAGGLNETPDPVYANNINAGTANASYTYLESANHLGSSDSQDFTIDKADSVTTISCPTNVTFTGSALEPCSATATGAGSLSIGVTVVYGNNINAGTATADATYGGDANHNGSTATQVSFTIDKADSTTTISCPTNMTYTGSPIEPCSATATGAGGLSVSVAVVYANNTNGGTAAADATYAGGANHNGSTATQVSFSIDPAPTTTVVTCSAETAVYTGNPIEICTVSVTGASLNLTPAPTYSNNVNVGTATASYTYVPDANHTGSNGSDTFEITPAPTTTAIDCSPGSFVYTGSAITPCTATVTGANLTTITTVTYADNTNVGTATVNASYAGDANHGGSTAIEVSFQITPAPTTTVIDCTPGSFVYTGLVITPCTATVSGASLSTTTTVTYADNTNVGTATANASYAGDANHSGSTAMEVTFQITAAPTTTVITCPLSVVYDGTAQTPCTALATGVNGFSEAVAVNHANNTDVGTATANATFGGNTNYQSSMATEVTFQITTAPSTTTLTCPPSVIFTGSAQSPCTANVTGAGGLNQVLTVSYTNNVNAGTASSSASYAGDANHDPSSDSENFTVDKAPTTTTVTFEADPYTYRGTAFTATASVTGAGGLNQAVTPVSYAGSCLNVTVANGCTASATYAESANHLSSTDSKSITLVKKALTVTASSHTVSFASPAPTITPSYAGLVLTETGAVIDVPPTCTTTYVAGSVIGTYPSNCIGGTDNNYAFTGYVPGTVTVTTIYCFNGFHSPVGGSVENNNTGGSFADPVKSFKLNSTIPFKFTLYNVGCSGSPITTGIHTIQLQKYSNQTDPMDAAIDATPTDGATTGNQFRLTGTDWHFNLDTKRTPGVSSGTWLVTATLLDGSKKTVWISIKK